MPETHLEFSVPLRTCPDSQSHVLILPSAAQQLRLVRSCAPFVLARITRCTTSRLRCSSPRIKFRHGSGFCRLLIRRFNGPEVSARCQMQERTAGKFHFEPPFTSLDHLERHRAAI